MHAARTTADKGRTGFTLIELLVVMLIIAILAGLSYAVLGRTGTSARIAATRSTIQQLDSLLNERMEAFRQHDFRNQTRLLVLLYNDSDTANPLTITQQAAERMVRKNSFRAAFPSRFEDLFGFDLLPGNEMTTFTRDWSSSPHLTEADFADFGGTSDNPFAADAPLATVVQSLVAEFVSNGTVAGMGNYFNPLQHDPTTESSELLYLALTRGPAFGVPLDSLDNIDADRLDDTDQDGLIEILDDWGNPIRFFNWPTRLMVVESPPTSGTFLLNSAAAAALIEDTPPGAPDLMDSDFSHPLEQDPDDPFGEIPVYFSYGATWEIDLGGSGPTDIRSFPAFGEFTFHTPNTWHRPLLVSAGPNSELGLSELPDPDFLTYWLCSADIRSVDGVIDSNEIEDLGDNVTNRQEAGRY